MLSGIARYLRASYYTRMYNDVKEFQNKSLQELDDIIGVYRATNIICRMLHNYPDERADYEAAKIVKNMRTLGLKRLLIKKKSVFGMMDVQANLEVRIKDHYRKMLKKKK